MNPQFWKVSQGSEYFRYSDVLRSIYERLVYVHKDTGPKGRSSKSQGEEFADAPIGDYFYLTHGNDGIYLLGQFSGPANLFSSKGEGWLDRPFRLIRTAVSREPYQGSAKWWAPNHNSTFISVTEDDLGTFETLILKPYFELSLGDFGVPVR